jgi:predicted ATPase with chaperone activity
LSGPLADRFHLRVEVPRAEAHGEPGEESAAVAERVAAAHELRAAGAVELDDGARGLLDSATERLLLSGRGRDCAQSVATTIAALDGRTRVSEEDVAEALAYRTEAGG